MKQDKNFLWIIAIIISIVVLQQGGYLNAILGFGDGYTLIGSSQELEGTTPLVETQYMGCRYESRNSWWEESSSNWRFGSTATFSLTGYKDTHMGAFPYTQFKEKLGARNIKVNFAWSLQSTGTYGSYLQVCLTDRLGMFNPGLTDHCALRATCNDCKEVLIYKGLTNTVAQTSGNDLIEIKPNLFDNYYDVFVNGLLKSTISKTETRYLTSCYPNTNSGGENGNFDNIRYQPLLGCQSDPGDVIVEQTFTAGTISLADFRYPVKQFCYSNPLIVIRGNQSGVTFDGSIEVFQKLIESQSVTIPEGDIWTIRYIVDNSAGIIPTDCGSTQAYNSDTSICTPLVLAFTGGTLNPDTNTFVIEPKTVCETLLGQPGVWNEADQKCYINQPVIEQCDLTSQTCILVVSKVCEASGMTYNAELQRCESDVIAPPGTPPEVAQNLWWYDDSNRVCGFKAFSGTYMYSGLYTFLTEAECKTSLANAPIIIQNQTTVYIQPPVVNTITNQTSISSTTEELSIIEQFNQLTFWQQMILVLFLSSIIYAVLRGGKHMWNLLKASELIAIVGAMNWGLVQFAKFDIMTVFGSYAYVGYGIVAAAGAYTFYELFIR
jgi:uncharacterized membrane protein YuzA (DUF378 family)